MSALIAQKCFDLNDAETVLGFLKDWTQGLSVSEALPAEARAAARLCLKYSGLLAAPNLYGDRMEEEFLQLLFKIPHAVPDEITAIIRSAIADEFDREYQSPTVLEHVTKTVECQPLCQHFPDLVIEVAEKTWRLQPEDRPRSGTFQDVDEVIRI